MGDLFHPLYCVYNVSVQYWRKCETFLECCVVLYVSCVVFQLVDD